ncbi:hypothetical protein ACPXB5_11375 [Micromonospora arida]|uniref:hypothetical protein n=1 Tax=Micromonospora arida TaxID=2203715 RepID=UPI003CFB15A4
MTPEAVAEFIALDLDQGWHDGADAWVRAHVDGASFVVTVEPEGELPRTFRAVLVEVVEEAQA